MEVDDFDSSDGGDDEEDDELEDAEEIERKYLAEALLRQSLRETGISSRLYDYRYCQGVSTSFPANTLNTSNNCYYHQTPAMPKSEHKTYILDHYNYTNHNNNYPCYQTVSMNINNVQDRNFWEHWSKVNSFKCPAEPVNLKNRDLSNLPGLQLVAGVSVKKNEEISEDEVKEVVQPKFNGNTKEVDQESNNSGQVELNFDLIDLSKLQELIESENVTVTQHPTCNPDVDENSAEQLLQDIEIEEAEDQRHQETEEPPITTQPNSQNLHHPPEEDEEEDKQSIFLKICMSCFGSLDQGNDSNTASDDNDEGGSDGDDLDDEEDDENDNENDNEGEDEGDYEDDSSGSGSGDDDEDDNDLDGVDGGEGLEGGLDGEAFENEMMLNLGDYAEIADEADDDAQRAIINNIDELVDVNYNDTDRDLARLGDMMAQDIENALDGREFLNNGLDENDEEAENVEIAIYLNEEADRNCSRDKSHFLDASLEEVGYNFNSNFAMDPSEYDLSNLNMFGEENSLLTNSNSQMTQASETVESTNYLDSPCEVRFSGQEGDAFNSPDNQEEDGNSDDSSDYFTNNFYKNYDCCYDEDSEEINYQMIGRDFDENE